MKVLTILAATVLLAVVAIGAVACSDDSSDTLSLEEYFQKIDSVQNDVDAGFATQEASASEPAADASGEEIAAFYRDNITTNAELLRDGAKALDDVEPPDEAAEAHAAIVAALNAAADALDTGAEGIPDSATMEELDALGETIFNSEELNAAFQGITDTCNALEQIATDNGIEVDLACDEG